MVRVAPINLAYTPRTLWFKPGSLEVKRNDYVVVETARGIEFGTAASDVIEVSDQEISALKSPLKPVLRIATQDDVEKARELEQRSREALPAFKEMAAEAHPDMHPVSVEFLFDGDKAVFYFESEERIDFRELVRKLASHFKVRIDMRQIGVRDEARIVGGLGHCGQELCCKRMGGEFCPVSIRMAKEQDLSLNPQKISGLCGRLMCCLRYEYDAYKDFKTRSPKLNATVQTPAGPAKVVELDVPREVVSLKVGDEKPVKVPLADFDEAEEGSRPTSVGEEAWDFATSEAVVGYKGDPVTFLTSQFTGADKLAEKGSVRHTPGGKGRKAQEGAKAGARTRGSRGRGSRSDSATAAKAPVLDETRKPRRRRSTKLNAGAVDAQHQEMPSSSGVPAGAGALGDAEKSQRQRKSRNRTHRAEGGRTNSEKADTVLNRDPSTRDAGSSAGSDGVKQAGRSSRGRSHRGGAKRSKGAQQGKQPQAESKASRADREERLPQKRSQDKASAEKRGPRPGQRSSGVRNASAVEPSANHGENNKDGSRAEAGGKAASAQRRPRRRSRGKSGGGADANARQGGEE